MAFARTACLRTLRRTALARGGARPPTSDPPVLHLPCVAGVRGALAYRAVGVGAARGKHPIVCIHGCPGSGRDFRYLAPYFEEAGRAVLRVDLPGHADSAGATLAGPPDCEHMGGAVHAAVEDLLGSRATPVLVAHSLGAHVALEMVRARPAGYAGVVLLAPAGVSPHRTLRPWGLVSWAARQVLHAPRGVWAWVLGGLLPYVYRRRGLVLGRDEILHCQRRIALIDFPAMACRTIPALSAAPASFQVLVASAQDDPVCGAPVVDELCALLHAHAPAPVDVTRFPTGGHWPHKHAAAAIAARVEECFD
eukprot:TRINITY_DN3890_c0_g1_i1.p3 TRINITY_DN3890_c0_g1~~TRINITY_DN3890_c0_g1_i1.p3  ORF type:complete len:308 (+),score=76.42 TRINITY_DN3890_c0_g1_i1:78-1001(+)